MGTKYLPFILAVLSSFHGTKLIFLAVTFGLVGYPLICLNLVIVGLVLILAPVKLLGVEIW